MLIYENNCNVFPVPSVPVKRLFDRGCCGLRIDDKKILLSFWRRRDMLIIRLLSTLLYSNHVAEFQLHHDNHTPIPASNKPVTESYVQK
jgi:hypothetical protein